MMEIFGTDSLPGYFYFFNLADTRGRNDELGFVAVNTDIEEFTAALESLPHAKVARTGPDQWMMMAGEDRKAEVEALLRWYAREHARDTRWHPASVRDGETRTGEDIIYIHINLRRAARCVYRYVDSAAALAAAMVQAAADIRGRAVSLAHDLEGPEDMPRAKWLCEVRTPRPPQRCLFCNGKETGPEDARTCTDCGAELILVPVS